MLTRPCNFHPLTPHFYNSNSKSMQRSETEAIRTQTQPSIPKREITKITKSQTTKRTYGQLGFTGLFWCQSFGDVSL